MKIKDSLIIRILSLVAIGAIIGLVGRTLITSWQASQEISQEIVDQHNPVLNKKIVNEVVSEIKSFQSRGLPNEEFPNSLEIKQENETE